MMGQPMRGTGYLKSRSVACQCGKVVLEAAFAPLLVASCYCTSCRQAGHAFEAMPSAPPVLDADGGTPVGLYRKDRIACLEGANIWQSAG
jgi:hypothetical protein